MTARHCAFACAACVLVAAASFASADTFADGANQVTIDFVAVPGDGGDLGPWPAGEHYTFTGVDRADYRIGVYEVTNDQWNKFKAELDLPLTGTPWTAYDSDAWFSGPDVPTNRVSWYEAAQFVNWLNTSSGHHPAYRFTGVQGYWDYALATWSEAEAAGGTNFYRHKDAFYYLPTEDEWVKAAYWNGTSLQTWATPTGARPHQGDGVSGSGWNFVEDGDQYATDPPGPWAVGSGSEELNGTFDMMGNVWEWLEDPWTGFGYSPDAGRGLRGGSSMYPTYEAEYLASTDRVSMYGYAPDDEDYHFGLRVAAEVPVTLPGDADGDGDVDLDDFAILKTTFGTASGATWGMGDFDGDGDVDLDDFAILKQHFGTTR